MRRIIPTILGKGQGFPEPGVLPSCWSLRAGLRTVTVLVGVAFSWLMCLWPVSDCWGLSSSGSWLIHHLGPIWFSSAYVMSLGSIIPLKCVPYPLPCCFISATTSFLIHPHPSLFILVAPSFLLAFFVHRINIWPLLIHQRVFQIFILLHQSHVFAIKKW